MADDWDPAKHVVEKLGRRYVRADGRLEGSLYPPEFYKYPPDAELLGGTWQDGLQAIEDFDWEKEAIDIDQEAEVATLHEPMTEVSPQPVTSRLFPNGIHESTASSPPISLMFMLQSTHDEPEDVEIQEAHSRDGLRDLPMPPSEATVYGPSSVSSSSWVEGPEKDIEDVVDTIMEEEGMDTQVLSQNLSGLRSPKDIAAEVQKRLTKVNEPAESNAYRQFQNSVSNKNDIDISPPEGRSEHQTIAENQAVEHSSRSNHGPSAQPSSPKDGISVSIVVPSEDELQDLIRDVGSNVQSTTKCTVAEASLEDPKGSPKVPPLPLSYLLHISEDNDFANQAMPRDSKNKNKTEAEIPAASHISEECEEASKANPLEAVPDTLPFDINIGVNHFLDSSHTDIIDGGAGTVSPTVRRDGCDFVSALSTVDMVDRSAHSIEEPVAEKSDILPVQLETRDEKDLAKPDDNHLAPKTASCIEVARHLQVQDATLTSDLSDTDGENEMSKTATAGVPVLASEISPPWIPPPAVAATRSGRSAELGSNATIAVPPVIAEPPSELLSLPSHISQHAVHGLGSTAHGSDISDDGLADVEHALEKMKLGNFPYLPQPKPTKLTAHSTELQADAKKVDSTDTKEENNMSPTVPTHNDFEISAVGSIDAMDIDVDIDNDREEAVSEDKVEDRMELDSTTTVAIPSKAFPNIPIVPHTPRTSAQPLPRTSSSASRFTYSKDSNIFQLSPQGLKRPRVLIFKSPDTVEKMGKDPKPDWDEETPPRKRAKTGKATNNTGVPTESVKEEVATSEPNITGGKRPARGKKQQEEPSDDEFDNQDERESMAAATGTKKNRNMTEYLKDARSVPQTLEKFQFTSSDGLPAHSIGSLGKKLTRNLLAAASGTTSPIKKPTSATAEQSPKLLSAKAFASPVKEPPHLPVLETLLRRGKETSVRKGLPPYQRASSNLSVHSTGSSVDYVTSWGRPCTRSESTSAPRPNYNLGFDEDDLEPAKEFSVKKPNPKKSLVSKQKRNSSIGADSKIDIRGSAADNNAAEALLQLASGPDAAIASDNVSDTDSLKELVATMFQKPNAKVKAPPKPTAKKPSVSKMSTGISSKHTAASTVKPTPTSKTSAAKHIPASTANSKTPASTAKATPDTKISGSKTYKITKATPTKLSPTPQSMNATPLNNASPTRNKYGFANKTNTRANTRSQALPPATPGTSVTPSQPRSSSGTRGVGIGTTAAQTDVITNDKATNRDANPKVPEPINTPLKSRTRAGKAEKEKTKDAPTALAPALVDSTPATGNGIKSAKPDSASSVKAAEGDVSQINGGIGNPTTAPLSTRTRAGKAKEELETNIGKRLRGAGKNAEKSREGVDGKKKNAENSKKGSAESAGGSEKKVERRKRALS